MRVIEFFRRRKRIKALQNADKAQYERDIDLAVLAPIAAKLVAGSITPEQAQKIVDALKLSRPTAITVWRAMSSQERESLGRDMIIICATPEYRASTGRLAEELRGANPALWEQAVRAGKNNDAKLSAAGNRILIAISGSAL